ncbi:MAG: cytochrome c [Betaproteobacteria bacterium]|nr:cytochrome c [Betaproteobacteria bacterium]
MNKTALLYSLVLSSAIFSSTTSATEAKKDRQEIERGRYLAVASGCHDCHTPGYGETAGNVPRGQWLTGSIVGFKGPWGTTYPVNLRLYVQQKSEKDWLARVRQPMRPPMPWFNLRDMNDADLVAIYRFVRALGPVGDAAPVAVAPGQPVTTPYIDFEPKNLPKQSQAKQ